MILNLSKKNTPKGWMSITLKDALLDLKNGCSSPQVHHKTNFPVTRIETISDGFVDYNRVGYVENINDSYKLQEGDLLFSNINSVKHIGKIAYFNGDKDLYHGMNLLLLRFGETVDKKFGYYILKSQKKWFEDHAQKAINQASINQTTLSKLELTVPKNKGEQKDIADILSTVDKEIQKVDEIVSGVEKLKKGLMTRFFYNGITGKNIKTNKLGDISDIKVGGTPRTTVPQYWNGDINWMASGEVNQKIVTHTDKKITKLGLTNCNSDLLSKDTVMIALAGQGKTRGTVAILDVETACNQSLAGIRSIDESKILNKFIYYNLDSRYMEIRNINGDGGRGGLNLQTLKKIVISYPEDIDEQKKVVDILSSIDEKIGVCKLIKSKLTELKKGLMSDLLSGEVRTTNI